MTFLGTQPRELYLRQEKVRRVIQHTLNDIAKTKLKDEDDIDFDVKGDQSLYIEIDPEKDINFHVTRDGFVDWDQSNGKDPDIFPLLL